MTRRRGGRGPVLCLYPSRQRTVPCPVSNPPSKCPYQIKETAERRFLCFANGGGFAFLRKSHGGCDSSDCRQVPPFESTFQIPIPNKKPPKAVSCFAYGGGFAFLRKSHGGCDSPPDCRQVPPFESTFTNTHTKQKNRQRRFLCLVGEGGFEPPKSVTTDLQSAPFGHSGIPPYEIVSDPFHPRGCRLLLMELVDGLEPPTC